MTDIATTLRRLRRLSRVERIEKLQKLARAEKPRSVRRGELEAALKFEMTAQLKREARAA